MLAPINDTQIIDLAITSRASASAKSEKRQKEALDKPHIGAIGATALMPLAK